jgi:hypothetical protein
MKPRIHLAIQQFIINFNNIANRVDRPIKKGEKELFLDA